MSNTCAVLKISTDIIGSQKHPHTSLKILNFPFALTNDEKRSYADEGLSAFLLIG